MVSLIVFERDPVHMKRLMKQLRENDGDFRIEKAVNICEVMRMLGFREKDNDEYLRVLIVRFDQCISEVLDLVDSLNRNKPGIKVHLYRLTQDKQARDLQIPVSLYPELAASQ